MVAVWIWLAVGTMAMAPLPTLAAVRLEDLYDKIELVEKKIDDTKGELNKKIDDTKGELKNMFVAVPLITTGVSTLTVILSNQKLDDVIARVENAANIKEEVKEEVKKYVESIIQTRD